MPLAALIVLVSLCGPAWGHSWYTGLANEQGQFCCGGNDCAELADEYVTPVPGGYSLHVPAGGWKVWYAKPIVEVVPNARAAPALEGGNYHLCMVGDAVRCFFFPAPSY